MADLTTCTDNLIRYLHNSHNTPLLPPKNLHGHCFRLLLEHFHVPGEIANNDYANVLGGNRGVLWDCASSELEHSKCYYDQIKPIFLFLWISELC